MTRENGSYVPAEDWNVAPDGSGISHVVYDPRCDNCGYRGEDFGVGPRGDTICCGRCGAEVTRAR